MNKFKECNQYPHEFNDKNLEPCKDCVPKKKTNADRIREMSDEELAEFLVDVETHGYHDQSVSGTLEMIEWLQSEAE